MPVYQHRAAMTCNHSKIRTARNKKPADFVKSAGFLFLNLLAGLCSRPLTHFVQARMMLGMCQIAVHKRNY